MKIHVEHPHNDRSSEAVTITLEMNIWEAAELKRWLALTNMAPPWLLQFARLASA